MRVYEYVMTHDTGFAPNPFGGFCTLACCKPKIRKGVGDYLFNELKKELLEKYDRTIWSKYVKERLKQDFGVDSLEEIWQLFLKNEPTLFNKLQCKSKSNFIKEKNIFVIGLVGKELAVKGNIKPGSIIYIMKVSDVITFDMYGQSEKYVEKIPKQFDVINVDENNKVSNCGDNIYANNSLIVEKSFHHEKGINRELMQNDLAGEYVLIADEHNFVYYGKEADGTTDIGKKHEGIGYKIYDNTEEKLKIFLESFEQIERKGIIAPPIESNIRMEMKR